MSVSEGLKKHQYKTYHITLKLIDSFGNKTSPPESLVHKIKIQPWTKVKELKSKISTEYGIINKNIRLFFENLELIDELSMFDYNIIEKKSPEINYQLSTKDNDFFIRVYGTFHCHLILKKLIEDVTHGFMQGLKPTLLKDGTSGTYTLRNVTKDIIGMFKPIDEEAFAPNNQKGYVNKFGSASFRKGILSGEGAIREFAAYSIDDKGLFDVPPTTFVEVSHPSFNKNNTEMLSFDTTNVHNEFSIVNNFLMENTVQHSNTNTNNSQSSTKTIFSNTNTNMNANQCSLYDYDLDLKSNKKYNYITKKYGSLQKFVRSTDIAANFSNSLYTTDEVHKIGILDLRILNCDRNDENILVIKKRHKSTNKAYYRLIPIDHSLSFPDCLKIYDYEMCWMGWDQAQLPFSERMKEYIKSVDIMADIERISKSIKLRDECWKMFRVSNIVLKKGAEFNLTLYDIGNLLYQLDFKSETPSHIELLIEKTNMLCSEIRVDRRLRLLSVNERRIEDYTITITNSNSNTMGLGLGNSSNTVNNALSENKMRNKRNSRLIRTTSEPKLQTYQEDNKEDEQDNLRKDVIKGEKKKDKGFESLYNDVYFYHFETFLIELIKKMHPEKYNEWLSSNKHNK